MKQQEITIDDFNKIELRTARILSAKMVPGSNHLIVCEVEVGNVKKKIVAGIGNRYKPEELVGKNVIIVNNLKPATLKGVLSQGMLLAALDKDNLVLLTTDREISSGAIVK